MVKDRKRRQYGSGSVSQRKDGRWIGRIQNGWTSTGTRRVISVSAKTEVACKRKLDKKRLDLANGLDAPGDPRLTVKAWAVTWLEQHQRKAAPKYYATDASAVKVWIIPTIGHRRLDALTPGDVRAVTNAVRDAGRGTTTAAYAQGVLERMLRAAIVEGSHVPARVLMLDRPGKAVSDRDAIPLIDARALLAAAATDEKGEPRLDSSRWVAALLQGMRQGECLGLTWDAIDFEAGTIDLSWQLQALPYLDRKAQTFKVPDGFEVRRLSGALHLKRPKSKSGFRVLPLVPWMAAVLLAWQEVAPSSPHGLVWPRPDGRPRDESVDRAEWYALNAQAGTLHPSGRPWLVHECRHVAATLLMANDTPDPVITSLLGHSSIVTSRGYMHTDMAAKIKAVSAVAADLKAIGA